jgi:preprotein translocase subunit SecD
MKYRYPRLVLIGLLILIGIWVNLPNNSGISIGNFTRSLNVVLGLDLQGGLQVLLEVPQGFQVTPEDMNVARQILENRSNGLGVSEVMFQVAGTRRIVGDFPGLTNTQDVIDVLKTTGQMEFVDLGDTYLDPGTVIQTDLGANGQVAPESQATPSTTTTPESTTTPDATATPSAAAGDQGSTSQTSPGSTGQTTTDKVWHTILTGDQLKNVQVKTDQLGKYVITFDLKPEGAQIFGDFTSANVGKYLAIVLDKKILSAPVIEGAITDGSVQISGSFTYQTANDLAVSMRYGSLPIPLQEVETRVIGPTLGADSLNKSLLAGIIGFAVITLFMLIYYRLPGFIAMLAIVTYGLITLTVYKLIPVTLTLPGIAGFLLSTGGALDANILIFERFKEELRSGRKIGQALELGINRAWPSIRDSNIATLITSAILFWFGSAYGASTVKGFALTLALGVIISLFSALVVTRAFMTETLNAFQPKNLQRWLGI